MDRKEVKLSVSSSERNISIKKDGSVTFIIGENGSGKTSLLNYIKEHSEDICVVYPQRSILLPQDEGFHSKKECTIINHTVDNKATYDSYSPTTPPGEFTDKLYDKFRKDARLFEKNDFQNILYRIITSDNIYNQNLKERVKKKVTTEIKDTSWDKLNKVFKIICNKEVERENYTVWVKNEEVKYPISKMSDGERSVFYILATIINSQNAENGFKKQEIVVLDEPEIHLHVILARKMLETIKKEFEQISLLIMTHDIRLCEDFYVKDCDKKIYYLRKIEENGTWDIIPYPDDKDNKLREEVYLRILGSKKPILFVEGDKNSYDYLIYRYCFPDYNIIPSGSCNNVKKHTTSFRKEREITNYQPVAGIIDLDENTNTEKLKEKGIICLSVSEIENLFAISYVRDIFLTNIKVEGSEHEFRKFESNITEKYEDEIVKKRLNKDIIDDVNFVLRSIHNNRTTNTKEESLNCLKSKLEEIESKSNPKKRKDSDSSTSSFDDILKKYNGKDIFAQLHKVFPKCPGEENAYSKLQTILKSGTKDSRSLIEKLRESIPASNVESVMNIQYNRS